MQVARTSKPQSALIVLGKPSHVFVSIAIGGTMTINKLPSNGFPSNFVRPQIAVVQPNIREQIENDDADWAELENELLSNSELDEIYDYLRSAGQLSA